ncbi:MAG: hypothetical protein H7Z38_04130 [Rubrivivax sp.]|nr:hypothetical protein [Pyrinomonadaceae bacterium]
MIHRLQATSHAPPDESHDPTADERKPLAISVTIGFAISIRLRRFVN